MPEVGHKRAAPSLELNGTGRPPSAPLTGTGRKERLALNVFDLDRLDPVLRARLLKGRLDLRAVRPDPDRGGETAVAFSCDPLTAALICDLLRSEDRRAGDVPTRVYLRRNKVWVRLSASDVLTEVGEDGKATLSHDLFPPEPVEYVPPPVKPVALVPQNGKL